MVTVWRRGDFVDNINTYSLVDGVEAWWSSSLVEIEPTQYGADDGEEEEEAAAAEDEEV